MKSTENDTKVKPNRIIFIVDMDNNRPYIQPPGATLRSDKDIEICLSIIQNGRELRLGCLLLKRDKHHDLLWLRDHVPMIKPEYLSNRPHRNLEGY